MEEKETVEQLLNRLNIKIYDEERAEFISFTKVIEKISQVWGALNDDYKNKIYNAMGIPPSPKKEIIPHNGGTMLFKEYMDSNPMTVTYARSDRQVYLNTEQGEEPKAWRYYI